MKIKRLTQLLFISCSILVLGACTAKHHNRPAVCDAADPYANTGGVQTAGMGEEGSFGGADEMGGHRHGLQQRTYYFDYDSNVVHDEDKPAIFANANYLIAHPKAKIILEGHTDPRGSREYNVALAERRANAVSELLISKGVSPSQIRIVSYGAERLAAPGHSEHDYQLDRRAIIVCQQR